MIKAESRASYLVGILWFILSLLVCETNDVVMKYLHGALSPMQIVFGRFFFGTVVLLPFVLRNRMAGLRSRCVVANLSRGLLLFCGMLIWCYGLKFAKLNVACLLNFTTPMFTLLLAAFFLKEKIGGARLVITCLGFAGVVIVLQPSGEDFNLFGSLLFLIAALFFAGLDILNKKLITRESTLCTLFYTSCFTAIFACVPAVLSWQRIASCDSILLLLWLGIGANLLLFCILKAFEKIDVSATAPFRYVELLLASLFGYVFFNETISVNVILGAIIIVPSVIFLVKKEIQ